MLWIICWRPVVINIIAVGRCYIVILLLSIATNTTCLSPSRDRTIDAQTRREYVFCVTKFVGAANGKHGRGKWERLHRRGERTRTRATNDAVQLQLFDRVEAIDRRRRQKAAAGRRRVAGPADVVPGPPDGTNGGDAAGARFVVSKSAGATGWRPSESGHVAESLRPDDRQPDERVPESLRPGLPAERAPEINAAPRQRLNRYIADTFTCRAPLTHYFTVNDRCNRGKISK